MANYPNSFKNLKLISMEDEEKKPFLMLTQGEIKTIMVAIIREQLQNFLAVKQADEELLSRQEVKQLFKISYVTLNKWVRLNKLPHPLEIAGRVFFRKSEIQKLIRNS